MTAAEIIRRAIPDASTADCEHILWGRTPFPMELVTARDLYAAAARLRRATAAGRRLCDHCDNQVVAGQWLCPACARVLCPGHDHLPEPTEPQHGA